MASATTNRTFSTEFFFSHRFLLTIRGQHAIKPREQFLGTVIGMQNDRNSVVRCHGSHMKRQRDRTGGTVIGIFDRFPREESATAVAHLNHDGRVKLLSSLKNRIAGR